MIEVEGSTESIKDLQYAAVSISATIIIFFVVYWAIQIDSVRELLELAYG
jgi:hypothetical protein